MLCHANDKNIPLLIRQLEHTNDDVLNITYESLIEIGVPAVPALIEALGDSNREYRTEVSSALAQIGMPAMPALIAALDHENAIVRQEDVEQLLVLTLTNEIPFNHKDYKTLSAP